MSGQNETIRADFSLQRPVVVAAPHPPPSRASYATREGAKARSAEAFASLRKRNAAPAWLFAGPLGAPGEAWVALRRESES